MRPIVKAVGLICILAHDYLIVKMKMLFGYPVAIIDYELSIDSAPVLTASGPFFVLSFIARYSILKRLSSVGNTDFALVTFFS